MKTTVSALAVSLLVASHAAAQVGSISRGQTSYDLFTIPSSPTGDAPRINFQPDPSIRSVAYSAWWYYRIAGDASESALNDSGGQLTDASFAGRTMLLRWDDVDSRGISALYAASLHETGPLAGSLVHTLTIQNNTAAPIDFSLFGYADLDGCSTPGFDTASGTPERHDVTDSACGVDAEFFGIDPTNYQVGSWPTVLDELVDGSPTTLANTGLPYTSGDYTGAMEWVVTQLQPGDTHTSLFAISYDYAYVDCGSRADQSIFGTPIADSVLGPPVTTPIAPPTVGTAGQFRFSNANPGATGVLLFGNTLLAGTAGIPVFGINLYVNPLGSTPMTFDANGEFRLSPGLPLQSAGICGFNFYFQGLIVSPNCPSTFNICSTEVVEWLIGM